MYIYQSLMRAAIPLALFGALSSGCAGYINRPDVPVTNSSDLRTLVGPAVPGLVVPQTLQERAQALKNGTDPRAYELFIGDVVNTAVPEATAKDIDSLDQAVGESEAQPDDVIAQNHTNMALPPSISLRGPKRNYNTFEDATVVYGNELVRRLSNEEANRLFDGTYDTKGGFLLWNNAQGGEVYGLPIAEGPIAELVDGVAQKDLAQIVKGLEIGHEVVYHIKHDGEVIGELSIYNGKDIGGVIRPTIGLYHNSFDVQLTYIPDNALGERDRIILSHYLNDEAWGRFVGDAVLTAGAFFVNPVSGVLVGYLTLDSSNEFGKVVSYENIVRYSPSSQLSGSDITSLLHPESRGVVHDIKPIFVGGKVVGFGVFKWRVPREAVITYPTGAYVTEDDKLISEAALDIAKAAAIVGPALYERFVDPREVTKVERDVVEVPVLSGHSFTGGNFLPGPPLPPGTR